MTAVVPILTAQRVALRRAAHQLFDHPRVFEDPLAVPILGHDETAKLKAGRDGFEPAGSRHIRAFMAARSRFAEDALTEALARGATQYVILGAGLDTYAYRSAHPQLRVFEVDHPATQAWKRKQLDAARIAIPDSLTFVPSDFATEPLGSSLQSSGFEPDAISFFSWLGVTPYLTAGAALATLAFIGSLPEGSGVVFDYAGERSLLNSTEQLAMDALASRVARAGEPSRLVIEPRALHRMLQNAGFQEIADLGPEQIERRYFEGRADDLQGAAGLARLVLARV